MSVRADLHIHTTASDGTWTPAELIAKAQKQQLGLIAVTDHDSVANVAEAMTLAAAAGITLLPAAEICSTKEDLSFHILGYGIDIHNKQLLELIQHNEALLEQKDVDSIHLLARDGWPVDEAEFARYTYDRHRGGWRALAYLIDKGHRHIALLTEEPSIFSVDLRRAGYEACMRAHDLPIPENYIVSLPPRGAGMDLQPMRRAFEGDTPPTAFFATSDEKAMRAIYWLRDNGYRVPEDISVIGFDDLPEATGEYPLTTIHQDFYMRGYVACESVLNRLNDPNRLIERRFLAHSLIERGSVRALKDQKI